MIKDIKAVVTDLDHTILKDEFSIEDISIKTFNNLRDRGIITVVATARNYYQAFYFLNKLKPDYVISDNGALVVKYNKEDNSKKVISQIIIPNDIKNEILDLLTPYNSLFYILESNDDIYFVSNENTRDFLKSNVDMIKKVMKICPYVRLHIKENIKDVPKTLPFTRICLFDFSYSKNLHATLSQFSKKYKNLKYIQSFDTAFEFGYSSKGEGLKILKEHLNLKTKEVIAFGDSVADIPMVKEAGIKVSVENGKDELKKECDVICDSVYNNGVEKYLYENIIKGEYNG